MSTNNATINLFLNPDYIDSPSESDESHYFKVSIAEDYGVNVALFLGHMAYWTKRNLDRQHNIKNGLCWSYDTLESFAKKFSYYSKKQVRAMIDKCIHLGLIIKDRYNPHKSIRTLWYALTPKTYTYFNDLKSQSNLLLLYASLPQKHQISFEQFEQAFDIKKVIHRQFPQEGKPCAQMGTSIQHKKSSLAYLFKIKNKNFSDEFLNTSFFSEKSHHPITNPPLDSFDSSEPSVIRDNFDNLNLSPTLNDNIDRATYVHVDDKYLDDEPKNGLKWDLKDINDIFDIFYSIYPVKKNKKKAYKVWVDNQLYIKAESIIDKLQQQIEHDVSYKNVKYIPYPHNYLLDERYEDDIQKKEIKERCAYKKGNKKVIHRAYAQKGTKSMLISDEHIAQYNAIESKVIHRQCPKGQMESGNIVDIDKDGKVIHRQELTVSDTSPATQDEMMSDPEYAWAFKVDLLDLPGFKFM